MLLPGIEGQALRSGRSERTEEGRGVGGRELEGAALSHSHCLVVQVICGGPRNADPQGSWWTNQPGERAARRSRAAGAMSEAAPVCQARQLVWQTHLIFHLVEGLWTWGPSGQTLLALYHAGGNMAVVYPAGICPDTEGQKMEDLGGGYRHSALT